MSIKTILITGATDGIGKKTALDMAAEGNKILLHGRNKKRLDDILKEIKQNSEIEHEAFLADFSSLKQTADLAEKLIEKHKKLDVLINNAAVFSHEQQTSQDGLDLVFQVNHLSHFLLTLKLLPLLQKADNARVVNVSSMIHAADMNFDDIQGKQNYSGNSAYALSKLYNILFTNKLAREYPDTGVVYNAVHPGVIETKLLNAAWSGGLPVSEGAKNVIYAAEAPEIGRLTGIYLENGRPMQSNPISYKEDAQDKLWDESINLLKPYLS